MIISTNTTWDDIERHFRGCEDEQLREVISLVCDEIHNREVELEAYQKIIEKSGFYDFDELVGELTVFNELMEEVNQDPEKFVESYKTILFELNFRRLFKT